MMAFSSKTGVKGTSMQSGWNNRGEAQFFVAITRGDIVALLGIKFAVQPRSSGSYSIQFLAHTVQLLTHDSGHHHIIIISWEYRTNKLASFPESWCASKILRERERAKRRRVVEGWRCGWTFPGSFHAGSLKRSFGKRWFHLTRFEVIS